MRGGALAVVVLAGCGRIWFDPRADAQLDAPPDTPAECSPANQAEMPYANSADGADGTAAKPFVLCTEAQLSQIAQHPEHWASAFRLAADINLTMPFVPIATKTAPFTGAFDGGGHTLRALTTNQPTLDDQGMFAYAGDGAHLHDLTLADVNVVGNNDVGALAGNAYGATFQRITVSGMVTSTGAGVGGVLGYGTAVMPAFIPPTIADVDVTITLHADFGNAGGVAGILAGLDDPGPYATVANATIRGTITGGNATGGAIGTFDDGKIDNSHSSATVSGGSSVGGLVGTSARTAEITHSSATGNVTCTGAVCGGLAGDEFTLISHSFATGTVMCTSPTSIECAGLVAQPFGDIEYSYATGDVTGGDLSAGLVSAPNGGVQIHDCYATGKVIGRDQVGGLVAALAGNSSAVARSYATGSVSGRNQVGGLVGYVLGNTTSSAFVSDSFAIGNVSGNTATNEVSTMVGGQTGMVMLSGLYSMATATCTNAGGTCTTNSSPVADATQFYAATNAPLTAWDFATVWLQVANAFPQLR